MEGDSITPPSGGNAPLTEQQGREAIANLLSGKPRAATPEVEKQLERPEPVEASDDADDYEASAPDGDEPADTDEEGSATDDAPEPVRIRLPDGTEATPEEIAEWKRGTLRQSDYTRKTQELAEQRKAFEQRQAEIAQTAQQFEQQINFAIQVAEAYMPKPPDPSMLDTDPIGYLQAKEAFETKRAELQRLYATRQEHENQHRARQMQEFEQMKAKEGEALLTKLPFLKDKARLETFQKDLLENLTHWGFKPDDLASVYDHRIVLMAHDAIAWRKLQASKPKVQEKAKDVPPVQTTGKRSSPAEQAAKADRGLRAELRKTGDHKLAARLLASKL